MQNNKEIVFKMDRKEFSYGLDERWLLSVLCFPFCFGFYPVDSHSKLVFDNKQRKFQIYWEGVGLYYCCRLCPRLKERLDYREIVSMKGGVKTKTVDDGEGHKEQYLTNYLDITLTNGQVKRIYIPENGLYCEKCSCFKTKEISKSQHYQGKQYQQMVNEICSYWESIKSRSSVSVQQSQVKVVPVDWEQI